MTPAGDEAGDGFAVGDRVRLVRDVDASRERLEGTVIGFVRLDPELIVITLDTGGVVRVESSDIERRG